MIEIFFATKKNNYSPKIFQSRYLATIVILLSLFNIFSPIIPSLSGKVYASSIGADELISMANQTRSSLNLSSLIKNSKLTNAAKAKAEDMFAKNYWSHYGPNGETPWQFIKAEGYAYVYAGENLAKGFTSSTAVHEAWLNSPTHRANIVKAEFKEIGIYVMDGVLLGEQTTLVVQMFGSHNETNTNTTTSKTSSATTKIVTKKSSSSKDTTPPSKPIITTPKSLDYLSNEITITGKAEVGSSVNIYIDDAKKSQQEVSKEGVFESKLSGLLEGEHKLVVEAVDPNGNISEKSDSVVFKVDTTPPDVLYGVSVLEKKEGEYILALSFDPKENVKEVLVNTNLVKVSYGENIPFTIKFNKEEILGTDIKLNVTDLAGNKAEIIVQNEVISQAINKYDNNNMSVGELSFGQELRDSISPLGNLSFRQKVNLSLAIFLIALMVIDIAVLYRVKAVNLQRTKSALHLPQFVLIVIVILFSGLGSVV